MVEHRHNLLVVDDEEGVRSSLRRTLRGETYDLFDAASGPEGLKIVEQHPIDLVISDQVMPDMTGLEFLRRVKEIRPDSLRIILTGKADIDVAVRAINEHGIYRFLLKPWDQIELRIMLRLAVRYLDTERKNAQLVALLRKQNQLLDKLEKEHPELFEFEREDEALFRKRLDDDADPRDTA